MAQWNQTAGTELDCNQGGEREPLTYHAGHIP